MYVNHTSVKGYLKMITIKEVPKAIPRTEWICEAEYNVDRRTGRVEEV